MVVYGFRSSVKLKLFQFTLGSAVEVLSLVNLSLQLPFFRFFVVRSKSSCRDAHLNGSVKISKSLSGLVFSSYISENIVLL